MAANKWEVILTPSAWVPDATSHPSMGVIYNRPYLAFDPSADEICYSKPFRLPDSYAGGTVTAEVCFAMQTDSTATNTVAFNLAVEALPDGGTDDTDANNYFGTGNAISSTIPDSAGKIKVASATVANKDSMAAGDMITLKFMRDVSEDTSNTGDARVFWVALYEA